MCLVKTSTYSFQILECKVFSATFLSSNLFFSELWKVELNQILLRAYWFMLKILLSDSFNSSNMFFNDVSHDHQTSFVRSKSCFLFLNVKEKIFFCSGNGNNSWLSNNQNVTDLLVLNLNEGAIIVFFKKLKFFLCKIIPFYISDS